MRQVLDDTLSLGAKNSVVHAFKKLVYYSLGKDFKSEDKNANTNTTIPPRYIAELDKELYTQAVSLPEAQTVSLEKTEDADKFQYGEFSGGVVYKTLDGDIDEDNKDVRKQEGWLILDRSSTEYALFVAESGTYIIAIKSFTPMPIVKDFMPLYNKLNEQIKHNNSVVEDSVKDDKQHIGAVAVTYREETSKIVTSFTEKEYSFTEDDASGSSSGGGSGGGGSGGGGGLPVTPQNYDKILPLLATICACAKVKLYQAWLLFMNATFIYQDVMLLKAELQDRIEHLKDTNAGVYGIYPRQIGSRLQLGKDKLRDAFSSVQAVVYSLPSEDAIKTNKEGNIDAEEYGINGGVDILLCYQNPETISYTSQANYDTVITKGTQIPLQYYNYANQIDLSFTLKWHIDEVETILKDKESGFYNNGLQSIAKIADGFTRPWDAGGSNKPKLCKVVLPSITHIGYITSAQITYSGDMTGSTAGIIKSNSNNKIENIDAGLVGDLIGSSETEEEKRSKEKIEEAEKFNSPTEYGYNQLEITFNMIVVQDIVLTPTNGAKAQKFPVIQQALIGERVDTATKVIEAAELGADMLSVGERVVNAAERLASASTALFSL